MYADDRNCPECYKKNEIALKAIRDAQQQQASSPGTSAAPSKIPTPKQAPRTRLATATAARNSAAGKSPLVPNNSTAATAAIVTTTPRPPSSHANKASDTSAQSAAPATTSIVAVPNSDISAKMDEMASYITKLELEIGKLRDIVTGQSSTISQLSQQVIEMKESINVMQTAVVSVSDATQVAVHDVVQTDPVVDNNSPQQLTTTEIVHRTLFDAERRRKNVIVSGLKEDSDDRSAFLQLCESHFSVKPAISEHDCKRLGNRRDINKPRLLLVRLRYENIASTILHEAKRLRNSQDTQNIFINPDLSREAAKAAFEARQRARSKRAMSANADTNTIVNANNDPVTINNGTQ